MIRLVDINKFYQTRRGRNHVLRDVNLTLEKGQKIGILGRNGAGKTTLIRILGGVEKPTSGRVERDMTVSWPLAFSGAFQQSLTGYDNLKFICRIYGKNPEEALPAVEDFAELGRYMREPLRTYSAGMRARLGFAISLVVAPIGQAKTLLPGWQGVKAEGKAEKGAAFAVLQPKAA